MAYKAREALYDSLISKKKPAVKKKRLLDEENTRFKTDRFVRTIKKKNLTK